MTSKLDGNLQTSLYPGPRRLASGLADIFRADGSTTRPPIVIDRKPNPYSSTFPTEIVTCQNGKGSRSKLTLFVKYGSAAFDGVYQHRGNVSYEAEVYGKVLEPLALSTPKFYGVHREGKTKAPWLFLEYVPDGSPASWSRDPRPILQCARWIGRFHALNEPRVQSEQLRFLRRYDEQYYIGWAQRTKRTFRRMQGKFTWLGPLCNEFEQAVPVLLRAPQTVIHGEFFGSNVLYQHGRSRPIDWQSAAVAAGEVDLASLTHSWGTEVVIDCEREYARARWPDGAPEGFRETLDVARLYMSLRWLGDPGMMSHLVDRGGRPLVSKNVLLAMQSLLELRTTGKRLGLID